VKLSINGESDSEPAHDEQLKRAISGLSKDRAIEQQLVSL